VPKPLLSARYRVVVRDREGRIIRIEEAPSKSFILNFLYLWWLCFNLNTSGTINAVNSSGQQFTTVLSQPAGWFVGRGSPAGVYAGIQVGSGTSAPSASSPYLESLILNGTSPGQLVYGSFSYISPSISSYPITIQATNTFINNSGGSVTVGEIGFAPQMVDMGGSTQYFAVLLAHDVLSPAVSVPNGGRITVTYTLQVNA